MKKRPRAGEGPSTKPGDEKEENVSDSPTPKDTSHDTSKHEEVPVKDEAEGGGGGGRTCVACRKSKVKCSRGLPCSRCRRLKLECVAQVRGRGRPVASTTTHKKSISFKPKLAKPEPDVGTRGVGGGTVGREGGGTVGIASEGGYPRSSSCSSSNSSSSSFQRGGVPGSGASAAGLYSSAHLSLRAGEDLPANTGTTTSSTVVTAASVSAAAATTTVEAPSIPENSDPKNGSASSGGDGVVGANISSRHKHKRNRSSGIKPRGLPASDEVPPPLGPTTQQPTPTSSSPFIYSAPSIPASGVFFPGAENGGGGLSVGGVGYSRQHDDASHFLGQPHPILGGHHASSVAPPQQAQLNLQPVFRSWDYGVGMRLNSTRRGSGSSWRAVYVDPSAPLSAGSIGGMGEDSQNDPNSNINAVHSQWEPVANGAPLAGAGVTTINGNGSVDTGAAPGGLFSNPTPHHRANDGRGSAFNSFNGKSFSWTEIGESKETVPPGGSAGADADVEADGFLSQSADRQARLLMDDQHCNGDTPDSEERLPQDDRDDTQPTDAIAKFFWKLFRTDKVHRPKAKVVIRHWALLARERRSTNLMRKTVSMAKALCIDVAEILNDYGIYAMFHELLKEAEAGNPIEPARSVNPGHQEAPPYIQELLSPFAAVSMRVVRRGQSCFYHNDVCARLFLSTEEANELYSSNKKDVWAACIHQDDHMAFFKSISTQLFSSPGNQSEFREVFKCRYKTGEVSLALVHFRCEFQDEGSYAAFGLSLLPLPESIYLQKIEQLPSVENAHSASAGRGGGGGGGGGDGDALPHKQRTSPSLEQDASGSCGRGGPSVAGAVGTSFCESSLPLPAQSTSARSSPSSSSSSTTAAGAVAIVGTAAGAGAGGGAGGGGPRGGSILLPQSAPPLDVDAMLQQRRVSSLPPRVEDAWREDQNTTGSAAAAAAAVSAAAAAAAAEMGGGTSIGLDESLSSWRESVSSQGFHSQGGGGGIGGSGGGGGGAFQVETGRGALDTRPGRGIHTAVGLGARVAGR